MVWCADPIPTEWPSSGAALDTQYKVAEGRAPAPSARISTTSSTVLEPATYRPIVNPVQGMLPSRQGLDRQRGRRSTRGAWTRSRSRTRPEILEVTEHVWRREYADSCSVDLMSHRGDHRHASRQAAGDRSLQRSTGHCSMRGESRIRASPRVEEDAGNPVQLHAGIDDPSRAGDGYRRRLAHRGRCGAPTPEVIGAWSVEISSTGCPGRVHRRTQSPATTKSPLPGR